MREEVFMESFSKEVKRISGNKVEFYDKMKNNGVSEKLAFIKKEKACPGVPVSLLMLKAEEEGLGVEGAAKMFLEEFCNTPLPESVKNLSIDREFILDKAQPILVNEGLNANLLEEVPYVKFLDLAVYYRCQIDNNRSLKVTKQMAETYGIDVYELNEAAMENFRKRGISVLTMREALIGLPGVDAPEDLLPGEIGMCVVSNPQNIYGAAAMMFGEAMERAARRLNPECGSVNILPSSVDEVLVTSGDMDAKQLRKIVVEVNCSDAVSKEQWLSDNVYRYDLKTKKFSIA